MKVNLCVVQTSNLKNALYKLQNDHGPNGFEAIASFHGAPSLCPENGTSKYDCCTHGTNLPPFLVRQRHDRFTLLRVEVAAT
jgi:hypothetical protein